MATSQRKKPLISHAHPHTQRRVKNFPVFRLRCINLVIVFWPTLVVVNNIFVNLTSEAVTNKCIGFLALAAHTHRYRKVLIFVQDGGRRAIQFVLE